VPAITAPPVASLDIADPSTGSPRADITNELGPRDAGTTETETRTERVEVRQVVAKVEESGMPSSGSAPSHKLSHRFVTVYVTQRVASTYAEARNVLGSLVVVELDCQAVTTYSAASNDFAAVRSLLVIPPSLCVDSVRTTSL